MLAYMTELENVADFEAWSGGADALARIAENEDALAYINDVLEEFTQYEKWTDGQLNDFLWFDAEDMLAEAGIDLNDGE